MQECIYLEKIYLMNINYLIYNMDGLDAFINSKINGLNRCKTKINKLIYHTHRDLNEILNEISDLYGCIAIYRDEKKRKYIGLYDEKFKIHFYQY